MQSLHRLTSLSVIALGLLLLAIPLSGCASTSGGDATGDDGDAPGDGANGEVPSGPFGTLDNPIFPAGESIIGNSGDGAGGGDVDGADCADLEHTKVRYCTRATSDCKTAGAGCMLVVVHNTDDPMKWVDAYGSLVVVKGNGVTDGTAVKHWMGELPLTVMRDYPGIDSKKVFFVGWSHGAGAAYRGMCHKSKGNGISAFGNNAEIYAGMVTLGGCPACTDSWAPSGKMHTLAINGIEDQFGSQGCQKQLVFMAQDNQCSGASSATWKNVEANDPLMAGDGTSKAEKLDYGQCSNGDVAGYRFSGEGHTMSFDKFTPAVKGLDMAWKFLQGKSK